MVEWFSQKGFISNFNLYLFRNNELNILNERLRAQMVDRDRLVTTLENSVTSMEERIQQAGREIGNLDRTDGEASRRGRGENVESILEGLRRIAQEVVDHCDRLEDDQEEVRFNLLKTRRSASRSPLRDLSGSRSAGRGRSRSPSFVENTFTAIQGAFRICNSQISELRSKLASAHEQNASVKRHLDESDGERRQLENVVKALKEEKEFV